MADNGASEAILSGRAVMTVESLHAALAYLKPRTVGGKLFRPPTVMIRGPHAIGKSSIVKDYATNVLKLPYLDRRIGQMGEGDIGGLPSQDVYSVVNIDGTEYRVEGSTSFKPVDWVMLACKMPLVLFMDEPNRATKEVMQILFQLALDYELNGAVLHPESRIFMAMNDGADYSVSRMDPALRSRFWTCDLRPSVQDWMNWAENPSSGISYLIRDFHTITKFAHLDPPAKSDAADVVPDRRNWHRLAVCLTELLDAAEKRPLNSSELAALASVTMGFVGPGTTGIFRKFIAELSTFITAEDILFRWSPERFKKTSYPQRATIIKHLVEKLETHDLSSSEEAQNVAEMFAILTAEQRKMLFSGLSVSKSPIAKANLQKRLQQNRLFTKSNLDALRGRVVEGET